jgi:hypothetical protein
MKFAMITFAAAAGSANALTFYEEVPSRACSGRNELGAQEGITVEEAKAWCDSTSSCVSFEKMEDRRFQFSTSCIKHLCLLRGY